LARLRVASSRSARSCTPTRVSAVIKRSRRCAGAHLGTEEGWRSNNCDGDDVRDALWNELSLGMMRRCAALLPSDRAVWAAAMTHELEVIEDPKAKLSFAVGCMWAAMKERTLRMDFAIKSVRLGAVAGMLVIALFGALSAWRVTAFNAPTAMVVGVSSVVFATAAVWTLVRGPIALVQTATMMLVVHAFALIYLMKTSAASGWVNWILYRALATEGLMIWGALLAAALFLMRALAAPVRSHS
jgi:hypothetical protein